jgi:hypothetical protein
MYLHSFYLKKSKHFQLLVGSVVIGAEFDRKHYGLIPHNYNWEAVGTT